MTYSFADHVFINMPGQEYAKLRHAVVLTRTNPGEEHPRYEATCGGVALGNIQRFTKRPHGTIKGTRFRKDYAPRPGFAVNGAHRAAPERLRDAVQELLVAAIRSGAVKL